MGAASRKRAARDSDYGEGGVALNSDFGANLRDVLGETELLQTREGRVHDGNMVRGTHRLREDVLHAGGFEDRAHAPTGDETGTRRGGLEHDATAIVFAHDIVRDRVALELHGDEVLVGIGGALLDRVGNFV